jgi:hypothetical protein
VSKSRSTGRKLVFAGWLAAWMLLAALVWWWAVPMQLERGCWLAEWPFDKGCADYPSGQSETQSPEVFAEYLQRNVGDGHAWARLARSMWERKDPRALEVLPVAKQFAPYNSKLLAMQGEAGVKANNWPMAAEALVALMERNHHSVRPILTAVMLTPQAQDAVLAQLNDRSRWLDSMLAGLDPKVPASLLDRYVTEGTRLGVLRPETVLTMVDRFKQDNNWLDAYTLWVAARGKVPEGLYNPGFDRHSIKRGFDWVWPEQPTGRLGMRVSQVSATPREGLMVEIEMTGRAALPQPMLSQPLLLLGDRYRLRGRYMSDRLRTDEGLVWAVRCAAGGDRVAQTKPLKDTERKWVTIDTEVRIPSQCGGVVQLQVETAAPWEANAGMAGVVYFDDIDLEPVTAQTAAATDRTRNRP